MSQCNHIVGASLKLRISYWEVCRANHKSDDPRIYVDC